jgi:hypothetical protein
MVQSALSSRPTVRNAEALTVMSVANSMMLPGWNRSGTTTSEYTPSKSLPSLISGAGISSSVDGIPLCVVGSSFHSLKRVPMEAPKRYEILVRESLIGLTATCQRSVQAHHHNTVYVPQPRPEKPLNAVCATSMYPLCVTG